MKAIRRLQAAAVVAYFAKAGRRGMRADHRGRLAAARLPRSAVVLSRHHRAAVRRPTITAGSWAPSTPDAADELALHLEGGRDVALLCEGDPFFYGSFMHLYSA